MPLPQIIHTASPGRRKNQFVHPGKTIKTRKSHRENLHKTRSATSYKTRKKETKNKQQRHKPNALAQNNTQGKPWPQKEPICAARKDNENEEESPRKPAKTKKCNSEKFGNKKQ